MKFSCLIGSPVGQSAGQDIYSKIFKIHRINSRYYAINLHRENLEGFFEFAREEVLGFNITAPYKEVAAELVDTKDRVVSATGSANLVKNMDGRLAGYNSDYDGFLLLLQNHRIDPEGKRIVIMGSGGAARTVAYAVKNNYTVDVSIASRKPGIEIMPGIISSGYDNIKECDILINCTPLGMHPDTRMAITMEQIPAGVTGIDVIYNPLETPFLKAVKLKGGIAVNGADMFIGQGMETLKKLYDLPVPYDEFRDIFYEKIK
jgi:shikimate dehydrogenase